MNIIERLGYVKRSVHNDVLRHKNEMHEQLARRYGRIAHLEDMLRRARRETREAKGRCEECGVPHGDLGYRFPKRGGEWRSVEDRCSVAVSQCLLDLRGPTARLTRIVLTVHHMDGVPENNQRDNLVALCQRCHLRADVALRAARKGQK